MALEIVCPSCGTDDDVSGAPLDDGQIRLTCVACKVEWIRDPRPRCPKCGGDDMYHRPQVILEKSRGSDRIDAVDVADHVQEQIVRDKIIGRGRPGVDDADHGGREGRSPRHRRL